MWTNKQVWEFEEINENLKEIINNFGITDLDFDACINNSEVEISSSSEISRVSFIFVSMFKKICRK